MQVKAARQVTRILKDTRGDNDGSDQRFGRESSQKVDEVRRLKLEDEVRRFPDKLTVGIRKREWRITAKFSAWTIGRMGLPLAVIGKAASRSGFEGGILKQRFWICLFYILNGDSRKEMNSLIWSWREIIKAKDTDVGIICILMF